MVMVKTNSEIGKWDRSMSPSIVQCFCITPATGSAFAIFITCSSALLFLLYYKDFVQDKVLSRHTVAYSSFFIIILQPF